MGTTVPTIRRRPSKPWIAVTRIPESIMDVIFDIDGTLADVSHRLHLIKDMAHWVSTDGQLPKPNWEAFLSDEMVAKDSPIYQTWRTMASLMETGSRVIFITGRPESQRPTTWDWLTTDSCEIRCNATGYLRTYPFGSASCLYMRKTGDRRPSHIVKEELLQRARKDGYTPQLVFEDRKDDTEMWRRNGLLCCQVAEGNY